MKDGVGYAGELIMPQIDCSDLWIYGLILQSRLLQITNLVEPTK